MYPGAFIKISDFFRDLLGPDFYYTRRFLGVLAGACREVGIRQPGLLKRIAAILNRFINQSLPGKHPGARIPPGCPSCEIAASRRAAAKQKEAV